MTAPDAALVDYLSGYSAVDLGTSGVSIFRGERKPPSDDANATIPVACTFVRLSGGPPPERFIGAGFTSAFRHSRLQVVVRDGDEKTGEARARATLAACVQPTIAGFWDVRVVESEPNRLPRDDRGVTEWTFNVVMSSGGETS